MRLHDQTVALTAIILLATACGGTPYNPWITPEREFRAGVHRIALTQVTTPQELQDPDPIRSLFDSLLTDQLLAAGFQVVRSSRVQDLWNHAVDSMGGYFDPVTGQADTAKSRVLRTYVTDRLVTEDSADVLLHPGIVIVGADYSERKARWDGASQTIEGFGSALLRFLGGTSRSGRIPALSFEVDIQSTVGNRMYLNRGGIEVWSKPGSDGPVPRAVLFADHRRNTEAVRLALRPIVEPAAR